MKKKRSSTERNICLSPSTADLLSTRANQLEEHIAQWKKDDWDMHRARAQLGYGARKEDADDILQQAYQELIKQLHKGELPTEPAMWRPYFAGIIRNLVRRTHSPTKQLKMSAPSSADPTESLERHEDPLPNSETLLLEAEDQELRLAFLGEVARNQPQRLSRMEHQIYLARYFQGMDYPQIAEHLRTTPAVLYTLMERLKQRLALAWQEKLRSQAGTDTQNDPVAINAPPSPVKKSERKRSVR